MTEPLLAAHLNWRRFWWGVSGAAAVEVYRWYRILRVAAETGQYSGSHSGYVIGLYAFLSIAMMIFGGVFASAWGEEPGYKCAYVGATFPFWLSGWTHGG
jgi:hypothetical protein